jgi:hypothetical protein
VVKTSRKDKQNMAYQEEGLNEASVSVLTGLFFPLKLFACY